MKVDLSVFDESAKKAVTLSGTAFDEKVNCFLS